MKNLFYFRSISKIGGTEQFLYEIAKKYNCYDITIYYDNCDPFQFARLSRFVRCRKRVPGEKVKCERAFLNFNIDMIDDLECEDITFVCHAIFNELGYRPPHDSRIKRVIAVSFYAKDQYFLHEGIMPEVSYNPLTLEPKQRVIHMVAATRLAEDKTKGGNRMIKFIQACDRYCDKHGTKYLMHVFTDDTKSSISKNVCIMQPRVDVRPFIADSDILIQLSNNMETYCYSINEALEYSVHICTTPLTVLDELNIPKEARFTVDWDMSNVDEVVENIFNCDFKPFKYKAPTDRWDEILFRSKNTYFEELKMKYLVRPIDLIDKVLDKHTNSYRDKDTLYLIDGTRLEEIKQFESEYIQYRLVEVIKQVKDDELDNEEYKGLERQFIYDPSKVEEPTLQMPEPTNVESVKEEPTEELHEEPQDQPTNVEVEDKPKPKGKGKKGKA